MNRWYTRPVGLISTVKAATEHQRIRQEVAATSTQREAENAFRAFLVQNDLSLLADADREAFVNEMWDIINEKSAD